MKLKDITSAYCRMNGLTLIDGKLADDDAAPILPFLMMDRAYQEFCKEVKPMDMRHMAKRMRNKWLADYRAFNSRLFSCLDDEQRDFAIELMDEYGSYIENDVVRIKVAVMNLVNGCEFQDQMAIGSLLLINILTQVAQITWGLVFRTPGGQEQKCPELTGMRNASHYLCNCVTDLPEDVHPNDDKELNSLVDSLMKRTTDWLNEPKDYVQD